MANFRYFRFFPYSGSSATYNGLLTVVDINLYNANGVDVAFNKNVTATSEYNSTNNAIKVVDGNSSTFWATANNTGRTPNGSEYLTIDLGSLTDVKSVKFSTRAEANAYGVTEKFKYAISVDGINWFESGLLTFNNLNYEENPMTVRTYDYKILLSSGDGKVKSVSSKVISNTTAVPIMTSETSPSGKVFYESQYNSYYAWWVFNGSITAQGYLSSGKTGYIGYEFTDKKLIGRYGITATSNIANYATRMIKDWTFEGSNDGIAWDILDKQVNITWTISSETKLFPIANEKSYLMYRVKWSDNNGADSYSTLDELLLFEIISLPLVKSFSSQSEKIFQNNGIIKQDLSAIDMTTELKGKIYFQDMTVALGSGKVFEHKIDTNKVLKKIKFQ